MDVQPNFKRLSEAFVTVSQEILQIPNVPVFSDGQRILDAINRLTTSVDDFRTNVEARFTTLEGRLTTLEGRFTAFEATVGRQFERLEDRMSADAENHSARLYNSHITNRETPLRSLYNRRNALVDGFPTNSAALMRLTGPALTTLFEAYGLPVEGALETKRRRFREFVGLINDA